MSISHIPVKNVLRAHDRLVLLTVLCSTSSSRHSTFYGCLTKNALHSPSISLTGDRLSDDEEDLLNLINGSVGAAGWLIVMSVGIIIAEIIFTVVAIVLVNIQPTVKLVLGIIVSSDQYINTDDFCYYSIVYALPIT